MFPAQPYSPDHEIRKSRRYLPHWSQEGVAYNACWRLADSLPQSLLRQWRDEREIWLANHARPWNAADEEEYHGRFTVRMEHWLDQGMGSCILRAIEVRAPLEASLGPREGAAHLPFSFVVMPNHVHLLAAIADGETIGGVIGKLKSWTTREINRVRGTHGPVWMDDYYDRIIRSERHFHRCITYFEDNPQEAKLKSHEYTLWVDPALLEARKEYRDRRVPPLPSEGTR